ncbi:MULTISPECIES: YdcF family protein [unclassified Thioalkalivibrio]|uniref:YdcF family protein n=1 Tax=unclassified Thioalkalivibrio TaxID=2621013 RepID=UPI00036398A0|nr:MULTISPECIES: YdcF family protein [unclassified Thioalkalivibrio]
MDFLSLRFLADWLLLPPSGPLLLALAGLLLMRTLAGKALLITGLLLTYAFSLPPVSHALMAPLQAPWSPPDAAALERAEAIVVLGAGYRSGAVEFSGETVNDLALVRLRYAAALHRRTGLPVVATGGGPDDREPEARWMAEVLEEFGVSPVWQEPQARDTQGNARHSAALLQEHGLQRVLLVTHAHHLPRATAAFERAGLEPIPAPTGAFVAHDTRLSLGAFKPQANAMRTSWLAMHEYLGILWYRWQYGRHPAPPDP